MLKTPLNEDSGKIHRERILGAAGHKTIDRIPTDMWATVEVQEKLFNRLGITAGEGEVSPWIGLLGGPLSRGVAGILELWDRLDIDGIFDVRPPYIGPALRTDGDVRYNEWGFGYRAKSYGSGSYDEQVVYPLEGLRSPEELDDYPWPDPDWYDYPKLGEIIARCRGRAVCCGYSAVFTYHNYLRGLAKSLMDPLLEPELCGTIIDRLSGFFYEYHRRCFKAAGNLIDFTQVTDDWGSQTGLLTSPGVFMDFYRAPMQKAIDLAKEFDIRVFHHDDGDMRPLLPVLTDMGIDILNPVQWRCGDWDLERLKKEYGSKICFHSAVDNQETLPLGTPGEVKAQVRHLLKTLGSDGTGFILGPCHNLQPNTPVENILALYEAAREFGSGGR